MNNYPLRIPFKEVTLYFNCITHKNERVREMCRWEINYQRWYKECKGQDGKEKGIWQIHPNFVLSSYWQTQLVDTLSSTWQYLLVSKSHSQVIVLWSQGRYITLTIASLHSGPGCRSWIILSTRQISLLWILLNDSLLLIHWIAIYPLYCRFPTLNCTDWAPKKKWLWQTDQLTEKILRGSKEV